MTDKIHDRLDGRLPPSGLDEDERRTLQEMEDAISLSLADVRSMPPPDLTDSVMARVRAASGREHAGATAASRERVSWPMRAAEWFWRPRTVRLRPAWALAGLAAATLALATFPRGAPGPLESDDAAALTSSDGARTVQGTSPRDGGPDAPVVYVRFRLDAAGASSVRLAGSFNGWQPNVQLSELSPGHWSALVPLRPGVHDYAFVLDGERWVADPDAIPVRDGFGGVNSRIALLNPEV